MASRTEADLWNQALNRVGDFRLRSVSTFTITSATAANPVVCTAAAHGLTTGDHALVTGMDQMTQVNGRMFPVRVLTSSTFELVGEDGSGYTAEVGGGAGARYAAGKSVDAAQDAWSRIRGEVFRAHPWNALLKRDRLARTAAAVNVSAITKTNPIVVTTAAPHGLSLSGWVKLASIGGMVEVSDRWFTVSAIPSATTFQIAEDGTGYTTYTSGGTILRAITPLRADFGYESRFPLPSDCLRLIDQPEDADLSWAVVGRELYTDAGPTVPVQYVRELLDPNSWDELLCSYLVARLAYELAEVLTQSNTKKEALASDMRRLMLEAKGASEIEASPNAPAETDWERARY